MSTSKDQVRGRVKVAKGKIKEVAGKFLGDKTAGSRHARCPISGRDLPLLWWCMTRAASWVITDLRPRGCRALSAQANRQTRSRVCYLANWRRIKNGLAKVSGRGCYATHSRVRW